MANTPKTKKHAAVLGKPGPVPVSFQVNLNELPVPQATVFANRCAVVDWEYAFEFAFFQARPSEEPSHVVSLGVSVDSVLSHFWVPAVDYYKSERAFFERAGWPILKVIEPPKSLSQMPLVMTNVFRMTRAGIESAMDCYYISPTAVHLARTQSLSPQLQPVVHLSIPAPVMIGLLEHVASQVSMLKGRLGVLFPKVLGIT